MTTVPLTPSGPPPPPVWVSPLQSRKRPHPSELFIEIPENQLEFPNERLEFRHYPRRSETVSYGGHRFGVASRNGKKKFMEDCHRVFLRLAPNKSFFGVYDGHGGKKAADFVAMYLHKNVLEMLKDSMGKEEKVAAFKAAFLKTDRQFLEKGVVSGACCVTAFIHDQELIVSNLGDCRAVLCRGGVAEALTNDHKAGREDERQRIESQDGFVVNYRGAWRVNGTLAVSRSFGDASLKQWVIAEPETRILQLEQDMDFLVLASDGLWDVVGNQEVVDIVQAKRKSEAESLLKGFVLVSPSSQIRRISLVQQPEELFPYLKCANAEIGSTPASKSGKIKPSELIKLNYKTSWSKTACEELVSLAVSRGSMDDITVVIIDLNKYKC